VYHPLFFSEFSSSLEVVQLLVVEEVVVSFTGTRDSFSEFVSFNVVS
jgi:hypothetical protein